MRSAFAAAVMLIALRLPSPSRADEFWKDWGDGQAELDGYSLVEPRYGELRRGQAVMIFVTEDFSDTLRVKADPGHPKSDVYPVLKLNFVRDFQTGIYDYNTMTSTFVRTEFKPESPWPLVKLSFASEEWCGSVYSQWLSKNGRLEGTLHSYFDGEADQTPSLPLQPGGVLEDQVPILVRGLRGEWLKDGESRTVPYLPSNFRARLSHKMQAWGEATVSRAGFVYTVAEKGGDTVTWTVDAAPPHRILGWSSTGGERGKLTGSTRMKYWETHREGDEKLLGKLGLKPLPVLR
jgi:hypothetical protein